MGSIKILLFFGLVFFLVSCEKSYAPDGVIVTNPPGSGNGGTTSGSRLIKTTSTGSNAETSEYEYNDEGKLVKITTVSQVGISASVFHRLVRDDNGRIVRIVTNELGGGLGTGTPGLPDSISINVHYPNGSAAFDYSVSSYPVSSFTKTDSTTYTYANGRITDTYDYQMMSTLPTPILSAHTNYTYSAQGNITSIKIYAPLSASGGASLSLAATITYEYDDKISPLQLGNEAFLGISPDLASKNNGIKAVITDNTGMIPTTTITQTLQYNTNNLPVTGTSLEMPANKTSTLQYFYK